MYEWRTIIFCLRQTTSLCQMLPSDFCGDISYLSWTCNSKFERKYVITYWAKYSSTGNASIFQYTIQLHHRWCRYKISYHRYIRQLKFVSHCNNDVVGRWPKKYHLMTQNCNTTHTAQLPTGLIIFSPVAVKIGMHE